MRENDALQLIDRITTQVTGRLEGLFETAIEAIREEARRDSEERTTRLATIWFRTKPEKLDEATDLHIAVSYAKNGYNLSATAKALGMHRRSLQRIMRRKGKKGRKRRKKAR